MKKPKYQFINSLVLKIIAVISMTLDHIGILLQLYGKKINNTSMVFAGDILKIFGRLAMPLIAICFAEAMRYTKDREHYMARLGLMTVIVLITEVVLKIVLNNAFGGNIFLTLLCSASFIYFYEKKDKKKFLYLIPLSIIFLSTASEIFAKFNSGQYLIFWPEFIIAQYSLYGFILCVGFYFMYKLSDMRVKELTEGQNRSLEELRQYPYYRSFTNILWCVLLGGLTLLLFLLRLINNNLDIYTLSRQSYALVAIIPILFYNGNKGYKSKKLQYSFYIYYPLHIIIIFLIFFLVFGKLT